MNSDSGEQEIRQLAGGALRRPKIFVDNGQLRDRVALAFAAIELQNTPPFLFSRGGIPARLRDDALEALDSKAMLAELAEAADWMKETRQGITDADPPRTLIQAMLGQRTIPLPSIEGIARAPFFTKNGTLVIHPGYHPDARVYLAPEPRLAAELTAHSYPECPSADEVVWARRMLGELFFDFPFEDQTSRAHTVALTLLPFVRLMIDGPTPNHAVSAPLRGEGTGKGLLVQAACIPALGEVDASPEIGDKEELRKMLSAAVLENAPIVWFDNIRGEINSGILAAIMTARRWVDRILGKTQRFRGRVLTTWVVAGNDLRFSREIRRRTILIELNANMPEAWKRKHFRHDLPTWALENRAALIRACVIVVLNWIARGRPAGKRTLGSFEGWSRVMGGILEAAGIPGFLDTPAEKETRHWASFIEGWWAKYGNAPVLPGALLHLGIAYEIVGGDGTSEHAQCTRLGLLLSQRIDLVFELGSYNAGFVRMVQAEVERDGRGPRWGFALEKVPRNAEKVPDVGEGSVRPESSAETKENSSCGPQKFIDGHAASASRVYSW